jgi:hypothetical protein
MEHDSLGRRRHPEQTRGLRPLHPPLPCHWLSKVIRVAMSQEDWAQFESLVRRASIQSPTQARANGIVISGLIEEATASRCRPDPGPLDWMDWERQKTLRLLRPAV